MHPGRLSSRQVGSVEASLKCCTSLGRARHQRLLRYVVVPQGGSERYHDS
jgi:hypothetical protein